MSAVVVRDAIIEVQEVRLKVDNGRSVRVIVKRIPQNSRSPWPSSLTLPNEVPKSLVTIIGSDTAYTAQTSIKNVRLDSAVIDGNWVSCIFGRPYIFLAKGLARLSFTEVDSVLTFSKVSVFSINFARDAYQGKSEGCRR